MPRPLAPTFRVLAIAVLVALPFAFLGACATETGVTPDCVPDVGANGVTPVANGCTGFAVCTENPTNPAACCRDADVEVDGGTVKGAPYTGEKLAFCLLSYGIGAPTSAASSSSSSGSSSSSSSTGTGN
jgi:hypothetical protein